MLKLFFLLVATVFSAATAHGQGVKPAKADVPPLDEIWYGAVTQDSHSEWKYLKGAAQVRTSEMTISADEIDFNTDTDWAYARGHLRLEHFLTGDILNADRGEYNLKTEEGKFYKVNGTSPAKIISSPGVLTTTNPFYFQAQWADRIKNRYLLHKGFVTDCKIPKPWWVFEAPLFDIVPGERAKGRHTVFRLRNVPILYLPYFYRPLGKNPRRSGFLTPNIGHSSIRGYLYGGGYYWAINRSYDLTYVLQYYTLRGPAHTFDFRGKPNDVSDFNFSYYAVQDKGLPQPDGSVLKEGGQQFEITGRTQILGFTGRLDYNYLSSYLFRQAFSNSYTGAISSEVSSIGFLQRHFKDDVYVLNLVAQHDQFFESVTFAGQPSNDVVIAKLPSIEVAGRDQQIVGGPVPLWFAFGVSAGLVSRTEPTFRTGWVTERVDVQPRLATNFSFKGFSLNPSVTFGATDYGKSYLSNSATTAVVSPANLFRKDADFVVDFRPPSIEKIYTPPSWLHLGKKLKHVLEGEATYEYVTGVSDFNRIIRFDETDIISNTNQLTLSVTNRLYKKDAKGNVNEFLTWQVSYARYYDPTFGGAIIPGQRNVLLSTELLTPYTFLDGPRSYSPIVSTLSVNPYTFFSLEYRADYDPLRHKFLDHTVGASFRYKKYFATAADTAITTNPVLVPSTNQISFGAGYGSANRRGWNLAGTITYDTLVSRPLYEFVQGSYNTDCCGFSVQLRRYNIGIRDENQYLFSFSLANLGTFGSLQKQDRIF